LLSQAHLIVFDEAIVIQYKPATLKDIGAVAEARGVGHWSLQAACFQAVS